MEALINYIKEEVQDEDSRFKPMVDTGELIDVRVAERAGIGFVGKNGLLITKEFGSYVYLGELITNIEFPTDEMVTTGAALYALCGFLSDRCAPWRRAYECHALLVVSDADERL